MDPESPPSKMVSDESKGFSLSIGAKLWLGMVLVVGAAATFLFFELAAREREALVGSKERVADTVAELFASGVAAPLDFDDEDAMASEMARVRKNPEVERVGVWVADDLRLRAASPKDPPWPAPADGTRVAGGRVEAVRAVVGRSDKRLGSVAVVFSLAAEDKAYEAARTRLVWLCALLALSTATVLGIFTRLSIVRPLERLASAVRRLERGEKTTGLTANGTDEVARLTRAFLSMREAVVDREARLGDLNLRLRELLDSMRQGILVFGEDRKLDAVHSRAAETIFGRDTFRGADVVDVLYGHAEDWMVEPSAFRDWCDLAFQCTPDDWEDVVLLAPTEIVFTKDGEARALSLELCPVFSGESLERVMALVSDDSEKRLLKEEAEEGARAVSAMRRLIATSEVFATFLERTRERVKRCSEIVRGPFGEDDRAEVFRAMHTIKGESHSLDLDDLANLAHQAEEVLASLSPSTELRPEESAVLADGIDALGGAIDAAEKRFIDLSPTGAAALRRTTVDRDDVERLLALTEGKRDELSKLAARLASRPFGEYALAISERVPRLAASQGKLASVEQTGSAVLVPPRLGGALSSVLVHLVRNCIAHGIEMPEERTALGKPELGSIRLGCEEGPDGPTVVVEDDGGGFDESAVAKAAAAALARADSDDASSGSSASPKGGPKRKKKAADLLSGRGVGLSAARDMVNAIGYQMTVDSKPKTGTRFVISPAPGGSETGAPASRRSGAVV